MANFFDQFDDDHTDLPGSAQPVAPRSELARQPSPGLPPDALRGLGDGLSVDVPTPTAQPTPQPQRKSVAPYNPYEKFSVPSREPREGEPGFVRSNAEKALARMASGASGLGTAIADTQFGRGVQTGVSGVKVMGAGLAGALSTMSSDPAVQELARIEVVDQLPQGLERWEVADRLGVDPMSKAATDAFIYYTHTPDHRQRRVSDLQSVLKSNKEIVSELRSVIEEYSREMQATQGRVPSFTDIKDLKDFGDWFAFNSGQAIPSLAVTALAGAAGGMPGVMAAGYGMGVGDVQSQLIEKGAGENSGVALVAGVPYALVERIGAAARPFRKVSDDVLSEVAEGYFRRAGREIPASSTEEFINEVGQTIIADYAVATGTDETVELDDEKLLEWFNAGMAGAAGGAVFGAGSAAFDQSSGNTSPTPPRQEGLAPQTPSAEQPVDRPWLHRNRRDAPEMDAPPSRQNPRLNDGDVSSPIDTDTINEGKNAIDELLDGQGKASDAVEDQVDGSDDEAGTPPETFELPEVTIDPDTGEDVYTGRMITVDAATGRPIAPNTKEDEPEEGVAGQKDVPAQDLPDTSLTGLLPDAPQQPQSADVGRPTGTQFGGLDPSDIDRMSAGLRGTEEDGLPESPTDKEWADLPDEQKRAWVDQYGLREGHKTSDWVNATPEQRRAWNWSRSEEQANDQETAQDTPQSAPDSVDDFIPADLPDRPLTGFTGALERAEAGLRSSTARQATREQGFKGLDPNSIPDEPFATSDDGVKSGNPAEGNTQADDDATDDRGQSIDDAAEQAESPLSPEQAEAGNYKKGHIRLQGLDITIENPRGSERSGVDAGGKPWSVTMPHHYGYIKRTEGADGEHVDVYIGPHATSEKVFVVDQLDADTKDFDEHKVLIGFKNKLTARAGYRKGFSDGRADDRIGAITPMSMVEFKEWLNDGDTSKPLSDVDGKSDQASGDSKKKSEDNTDYTDRTEKIEDFGEKIGGARKDAARSYETLLYGELDETAGLKEFFPMPDYEALSDIGVPIESLAALSILRDAIPPKPRKRYKVKRWVSFAQQARDAASKILDGELKTIEEFSEIGVNIERETHRALSSLPVGMLQHAGGYSVSPKADNGYWVFPPKGHPRIGNVESMSAVVEAIKANIALATSSQSRNRKPADINVMSHRVAGVIKYFAGFKISNAVSLSEDFDTSKEARDFIKENYDALLARAEQIRDGMVEHRTTIRKREGPKHRDGNVTPEDFSKAFGFRGVEFGNWLTGTDRQTRMNEAYDALMDLAGIINVPSTSLSLDGTLGLAFGARGRGGRKPAAAHYEPMKMVINLTKNSGAGTLAHEWFHAVDNWMAKAKDSKSKGMDVWDTQVNAKALMAALRQKHNPWFIRSKRADDARSKPYFTQTIELAARAFEGYVDRHILARGMVSDFLTSVDRTGGAYPNDIEFQIGGVGYQVERYIERVRSAISDGQDSGISLPPIDPEKWAITPIAGMSFTNQDGKTVDVTSVDGDDVSISIDGVEAVVPKDTVSSMQADAAFKTTDEYRKKLEVDDKRAANKAMRESAEEAAIGLLNKFSEATGANLRTVKTKLAHSYRFPDGVMSRAAKIVQIMTEGGRVVQKGSGRKNIEMPDGSFFGSDTWTKYGISFAEWLERESAQSPAENQDVSVDEHTEANETVGEDQGQSDSESEAAPEAPKVARAALALRDVLGTPDMPTNDPQLMAFVSHYFGGTVSDGAFSPKEAYDALELALNIQIQGDARFSPSADLEEAKKHVGVLDGLLNMIPTQTRRDDEMVAFQQYSTPPSYAFAVNWIANPGANESVLEPSAGNGGIAIFAKKAGALVDVNELAARRLPSLQYLDFNRVTSEDGEQIHNIWASDDDRKYDVVVMNPPFSSTGNRGTKNTSANGANHIQQAFNLLKPGGRLVAIVGHTFTGSNKRVAPFFKSIAKEGAIRANVLVSGQKVYKKFGTTYDNRLIVIDKVKPTDNTETIGGSVESIPELLDLLKGIRRVQEDRAADVGGKGETGKTLSGRSETGTSGAENSVGRDKGRQRDPDAGRSRDGRARGRSTSDDGARDGSAEDRTDDGKPKGDSSGDRRDDGDRSERKSGVTRDGNTVRLTQADKSSVEVESQGSFAKYRPSRVRIKGAKEHPMQLVESEAMASVLPPQPTYTPKIPNDIIKKGLLSEAQLEQVVYAGEAHSSTIRDTEGREVRRGYYIGDGTGVGKTREIAGIISDNWQNGRKRHILVSKDDKLFDAAKRDFKNLGLTGIPIHNIKKTKSGQPIEDGNGVLFATYTSLAMSPGQGKKSRLEAVTEWMGDGFDGTIIFDEAHLAGNAVEVKGKRGKKKPSKTALAVLDLQRVSPEARIVYASATAATEVSNLSYAERLGLWGEGTPFPDVHSFVGQVESGGVAAMEIVGRDMKQMGVYMARSLSFEGVEYEKVVHELTPDQKAMYDVAAQAWQKVLSNIGTVTNEMTNGGSRQSSAANSAFWGAHQRFFSQVLTSLQMPTALKAMKADIKAGMAPVVQIVNTNKAATDRALSKVASGDDLESLDITPKETLMNYLETAFPVQQFEPYVDEDGNERTRPVVDSKGNPVLNAQAVAARDNLIADIASMRLPGNPLDMIIETFGPDRVAEVTGRDGRIVKVDGRAKRERRTPNKVKAEVSEFMDGKRDILVFSDAGGTGMDFHADKGRKNTKRRSHFVLQSGWRADRAIQGFGRTHRTNQASAPIYKLVGTDISGHKRFTSSIARRLEQLGALTKGQRDASSSTLFSAEDNLENEYAEDAVRGLFSDLAAGNVDGFGLDDVSKKLGISLYSDGQFSSQKVPSVTQFLNRLLNVEIDLQNMLFDEFTSRMRAGIEAAVEAGTYTDSVESISHIGAEVEHSEVFFRDERTGAETTYSIVKTKHDLTPIPFEEAERFASNVFKKHRDTGAIYAFRPLGQITLSDGRVMPTYRRTGPDGFKITRSDEYRMQYDMVTSQEDARALWDEQLKEVPESYERTRHMITGALLPIYDRLPVSAPKIISLTTDDGDRLLGREIPEVELARTLNNLGINGRTYDMSPSQLIDAVEKGARARLSSGHQLVKRKVGGEQRIEIVAPELSQFADMRPSGTLDRMGALLETIGYKRRAFVPGGNDGIQVVARLLNGKSIVGLDSETAQTQPESISRIGSVFRSDKDLKKHSDYRAAKGGNELAAARLVLDVMPKDVLDNLARKHGPDTIVLPAHAEEASGRNKIPRATAKLIAKSLGAKTETSVNQTNRAFHTGASALERIMTRAVFQGPVKRGGKYLLVDDVTVMGSTLADLASHIVRNGGEVVGVFVLANSGRTNYMVPTSQQQTLITRRFGHDIEDILGIQPEALTAAEAQYLSGYRNADELRDRGTSARRDRVRRLNRSGAGSADEGTRLLKPRVAWVKAPRPTPPQLSRKAKRGLRDRLDKLGLKRVRLEFDPQVEDQGVFRFSPDEAATIVIGSSQNADATLDHEAIHALRAMNLFTAKEWDALSKEAERRWIAQFDIRNRYADLSYEAQIEEAIAEAFAGRSKQPKTPIKTAFAKIKRFLRAIREVFSGKSIEAIFEDIESGAVGARKPASPSNSSLGYGARYQRPHTLGGDRGGAFIPDRRMWDELAAGNASALDKIRYGKGVFSDAFDRFRTKFQDRFLPILRAQQAVEKAYGRAVPKELNAYLAEELYSGRVGYKLDKLNQHYVQPIVEAIAKSKTLSVETVGQYLYARHAVERNERIAEINPGMPDGGSGMETSDAIQMLDDFHKSDNAEALKDIASKIDEMREWSISERLRAGLISEAEAIAWRNSYNHYVPLKGWAETEHSDAQLDLSGMGRGFNTRGPETKMALGRSSQAFNPLVGAITQAQEVAIRSEKNRVAQHLYRLAKDTPSKNLWTVKQAETVRVFNSTTGQVETRRKNPVTWTMADNEMAVKVGGKEFRVIFHDHRIARAALNLGVDQFQGVVRYLGWFSRYFSSINTMMSPAFVLRNAFRDFLTANVTIHGLADKRSKEIIRRARRSYFKALVGSFGGLKGKTETEWQSHFDDFSASGGKIAFWKVGNPEDAIRDLDKMVQVERSSTARNVLRIFNAQGMNSDDNPVISLIERTNLAVDNALRLAVFVEGKKAGLSAEEAASLAKNLTVNFNRRGEYGALLNAIFPFSNAAIQGTHTIFRVMKARRVVGMVAVMVTYGLMSDLINSAVSEEDEDGEIAYDKIPEHVVRMRLIAMHPGSGSASSIPLPYGFNVFPYMGIQLGKVLRGKKDIGQAMADLGAAAAQSFLPTDSVIPEILSLPVDLATNEDWLGRPIRPENPYSDYGPQSQKFYQSVSIMSRDIAHFLNAVSGGSKAEPGMIDISPEYLDHVMAFATGGLGRFVGRVSNVTGKLAGGEDVEMNDVPFMRDLSVETGIWLDRNAFYTRRDEIREAVAAVKVGTSSGEWVSPESRKLARLNDLLKDVEKKLRAMRTRQRSGNPSSSQRRSMEEAEQNLYNRLNGAYLKIARP